MGTPLSEELQRLESLTKAIKTSENKLTLALSLAYIGVWILDVQTNRLEWDEQMRILFEVEDSEFEPTYQFFESRLHPDDVKGVNQAVKEALHGEEFDYTYRVKCHDGGFKRIRGKGKATFDIDGKPVEFVGVCLIEAGCG